MVLRKGGSLDCCIFLWKLFGGESAYIIEVQREELDYIAKK